MRFLKNFTTPVRYPSPALDAAPEDPSGFDPHRALPEAAVPVDFRSRSKTLLALLRLREHDVQRLDAIHRASLTEVCWLLTAGEANQAHRPGEQALGDWGWA